MGDKPALIEGPTGRALSYAELVEGVEGLAAGLARRGFQKGDGVALLSPNSPEYVVVLLAVSLLGGVTTTLNPLYTPAEIRSQVKDAESRFFFSHSALDKKVLQALEGSSVSVVFFGGEEEGNRWPSEFMSCGSKVEQVGLDPRRDVVMLPYSSGTTGFPKGVMLTHFNLLANICQLGLPGLEPVTEKDRVMAVLPFFHIYGMVVILLRGLHCGATLVTLPRFDLEQFLNIMQDYSITRTYLVPPIVLAMAKQPRVEEFDLSHLKSVNCGAAPLGEEVALQFMKRLGCVLKQGYGLTEASPVTHLMPESAKGVKLGSIGPPLSNTECRVVDMESGADLGVHESGEIWIRGPQVMQGYWKSPEATSSVLDDEGWLRTGDVGYADGNRCFFIVDRVKEMIKYKGFQVAPAELEAILLSHTAVSDAAVIGSPDEEAGEVPKAFIVATESVSAEEIMEFVADQVAPHKKIRRLQFTEQIPKSASGKILRRLLLEKERERSKEES